MSMRHSTRTHTLWDSGFIEGVGEVPGGPRSQSKDVPSDERIVQLRSGSTAIVPFTRNDSIDALNRMGIQDSPTMPEVEEPGQILATLPTPNETLFEESSKQLMEPIETIENATIKEEPDEDNNIVMELDENYMSGFMRMLAEHAGRSRPDPCGSRRQEAYEGHRTRSEVKNEKNVVRDRSRTPTRLRSSNIKPSQRSSPMIVREHSRRRYQELRNSRTNEGMLPGRDVSESRTPDQESQPGEDEEASTCTCPISYKCSHRRPQTLDCRPLVLEPLPRWEERDQEDFEKHREALPIGERFTTNENLISIIATLASLLVQSHANRRKEVRRVVTWILSMEDVTLLGVIQQQLSTTQVVPAIQEFLAPENTAIRRAAQVPGYIEEELTVLQRKWTKGDFSASYTRGLDLVEQYDLNNILRRKYYKLDKSWQLYTDARYLGEGELVNGQIWMSRLELMRDGVHAARQAGISGRGELGAYSIVLGSFDEKNNKGYADIDMGDVIEYMGTALPDINNAGPTNDEDPQMHDPADSWKPDRDPTHGTRALMQSFETGQPVRVIRSWQMHSIVKNKPVKGYRYDGLYRVVGKTPMKQDRQIWSFRMERLPNRLPTHGPLRGFRRREIHPDSNGRRRGYLYRG